MLGNLAAMMKQLQQVQKRGAELQEELAALRIEATAGGGLVTITTDGTGAVLEIKIDGAKLGLDEEHTELLCDALLAAAREAKSEAEANAKEVMSELTEGLPLPPGLKLG